MFRFSWHKIYSAANGNVLECFRIFKMLVKSEIPKNKYDPIYKYRNNTFYGNSFLLNPEVLLYNAYQYSRKEIVEYIAFASFRSLAEYKIYGTITLDLWQSPVDPKQHSNRLLSIKEGKLHFLYEKSF